MASLFSEHDFKFQKKYGQNFLTDVKIPRRIAMECTDYTFDSEQVPETKAPYLMLEIGQGAFRHIQARRGCGNRRVVKTGA